MMEKLQNLSFSTKTLLVASGVVLSSAGAYFLYRKLSRRSNDPDDNIMLGRQPSENIDDSDSYSVTTGKKVLVLGLEKSGKSCLLAALTNEEAEKPYLPTLGFNVVCITNISERLDIMEVGGSQRYREHWSRFLAGTSVLVYVIDSCERQTLAPAMDALQHVLTDASLENVPVVIVFSKRDGSTAIPTQELISSVRKEHFGDKIYQYTAVQVKCGGAQTTNGVTQLQETLVDLASRTV